MSDPSITPPGERRACAGSAGKKRTCWAREGSDWCSNHDPALAEARRANGRTRKAAAARPAKGKRPGPRPRPENAPDGWRPEWRRRRPERGVDGTRETVERAVAILEAPLPPPQELREEALRALRSIVLDAGLADTARVGAARELLKATATASTGDTERPETDAPLEELLSS